MLIASLVLPYNQFTYQFSACFSNPLKNSQHKCLNDKTRISDMTPGCQRYTKKLKNTKPMFFQIKQVRFKQNYFITEHKMRSSATTASTGLPSVNWAISGST